MSKNIIVNPLDRKGEEIKDRIKELMGGISPINESVSNTRSVVELTKKGPDGNAYAIVRENHEYYIKYSTKTKDLTLEDFNYIGGLKNKKDAAYPSYAKAIKHLNLKFNSLNEAYGKNTVDNVFEDDNLLAESGTATSSSGFGNQSNMDGGESLTDEPATPAASTDDDSEEKLTEVEQAVHDMGKPPKEPKKGKKLSIATAIDEMDEIISDMEKPKKKVYSLK
jgi:hypothetical protein